MQVAFEIIERLKDAKFHSGVELAKDLRVGRTTVWKAIRYLRSLGVSIDAVRSRGYKLTQPLELLDKDKILSELSDLVQKQIYQFDVLPAVASTNDYLLSQIAYGQKPFSICLSESQTQGKGRQGKVWQSPFGRNLYLSVYGCFNAVQNISGFSLSIATTILNTIEGFCTLPEGLGIKWPNDLMYGSAKIGGILIETQSNPAQQAEGIIHVVIGIGLNFDMEGFEPADKQWTDLKSVLGQVLGRNLFAGKLINKLLTDFVLFDQFGFDHFYSQWERFDLLKDKQIEISTPFSKEQGQYRGINKRGELLVEVAGALKALTYGNVSIKYE
ncbi:biotin--[acetyl-CoA-carboxylase] ligase [Candidatus Berkiella cookevillensis]|uniref:Bifunctional ligase/repressor BirA n=1 Tax=Candidatus Berkiella cookevillensis TaxID=437022 RepID=A0A0Q9YNF2_9GAMM|nr:biotin--[acetyl-CoA-carboxylase] ligase [Candidatus Berkiella cookevillensis]MCS5709408.1 biotin--[acetyl-CoA-carboxylase] ligase [Candidatus Berkiella cookevillensis]